MSSYAITITRIRSTTAAGEPPGGSDARSFRSTRSRACASWKRSAALDCVCGLSARRQIVTIRARRPGAVLPELGIDFLEIAAVDQDLARLPAGAGRHQAFRLHHVDEAGGAAEPDAQLALKIR